MDDLKNPRFFDRRIFAVLSHVLNEEQGRRPETITSFERILLQQGEVLRALDTSLQGELYQLVVEVSPFVAPQASLKFLVSAQRRTLEREAALALRKAAEEGLTLHEEALKNLLFQAHVIPMDLNVFLQKTATGEERT